LITSGRFYNEDKITEAELCDGLRTIIHKADIATKRSTYTTLDPVVYGPENYSTGNVFEKYSLNNSITFGYRLNKDDINTDITKTYYKVANETVRSFSTSDIKTNVDMTKFVTISGPYDSDIELKVSITDNIVQYKEETDLCGGITKEYTFPIHFYNKVFLTSTSGTISNLNDSTVSSFSSTLVEDKGSFKLTVEPASSTYNIILCTPTAWGDPDISVGGLTGGFIKLDSTIKRSIGSNSVEYNVYKSVVAGLGKTTIYVEYN
jgi:hypothetical protein